MSRPDMKILFKSVGVGGTFDKLHKGHITLIMKALEVGECVYIGICSDELVKKLNKNHKTASFNQRLEALKGFLKKNELHERAVFLSLEDSFGITLSSNKIEALVVSNETYSTALIINKKRKAMHMIPLQVIVVDMFLSEDNIPINTTRIYKREINHEGRMLY